MVDVPSSVGAASTTVKEKEEADEVEQREGMVVDELVKEGEGMVVDQPVKEGEGMVVDEPAEEGSGKE